MKKRNKTITKWSLYWQASKLPIGIGLFVGVILLLMLLPLLFIDDETMNIFYLLLLVLGGTIFMCLMQLLMFLPITIRGILHIKNQERFFGFKFDNEMKNHNINSFSYQDNNWFIGVTNSRIYAYRGDYFNKLDEGIEFKTAIEKVGYVLRVETKVKCVDGKTILIVSDDQTIKKLKEWIKNLSK